MHYLKLFEVCGQLQIEEKLARLLDAEGLITIKQTVESEAVLSLDDADRLRVGALLMQELDVNLAGVEVILHMREEIIDSRRQLDEILHAIVEEVRARIV